MAMSNSSKGVPYSIMKIGDATLQWVNSYEFHLGKHLDQVVGQLSD